VGDPGVVPHIEIVAPLRFQHPMRLPFPSKDRSPRSHPHLDLQWYEGALRCSLRASKSTFPASAFPNQVLRERRGGAAKRPSRLALSGRRCDSPKVDVFDSDARNGSASQQLGRFACLLLGLEQEHREALAICRL
jgi:hypothetical protein